jgi:hypothetical protein
MEAENSFELLVSAYKSKETLKMEGGQFPQKASINLQDYKSTSSLKIEALSSSETLMSNYKTRSRLLT